MNVAKQGDVVTVRLLRGDAPFLIYQAAVLFDDGNHIVVRARWAEPLERDVGYVRFEPDDVWTEHYWRDRWYAIKEVSHSSGAVKGWYCDVTRPATVCAGQLDSEDLYLDLWVSGDFSMSVRLDEDELIGSGLIEADPGTADAARRALDELERLARDSFRPIPMSPWRQD